MEAVDLVQGGEVVLALPGEEDVGGPLDVPHRLRLLQDPHGLLQRRPRGHPARPSGPRLTTGEGPWVEAVCGPLACGRIRMTVLQLEEQCADAIPPLLDSRRASKSMQQEGAHTSRA